MAGNNGRPRLYTVDISPAARRQIARLQRSDVERVEAAIYSLQYNPRPPGSVKLRGAANRWRIQVIPIRSNVVVFPRLRTRHLMLPSFVLSLSKDNLACL